MKTDKANIEKELSGTIPESKLKLLKAKHKEVKIIEVDMEDGEIAVAYFKVPSLQIHSIAMAYVSVDAKTGEGKMTDLEKFTNIIIENCWLAGDDRIKEDEFTCSGIATSLFGMVKKKVFRIKNV